MHEKLADEMVEWFSDPTHYSVVHFAVEKGMSKQDLFRLADEDEYFKQKLEYAFSVQEYKVVEGAISGALDRTSALKMLETYNGWKGDVNIYQKVEQSMSPELAERLAEAIERIDVVEDRV